MVKVVMIKWGAGGVSVFAPHHNINGTRAEGRLTHLAFGLCWSTVAVVLFVFQGQANLPFQQPGIVAAFAGLLAAYNFLRFGINWLVRRLPRTAEPAAEMPRCPKCGAECG